MDLKCRCFPEANKFKKQYQQAGLDNKLTSHEIDHTWPTVKRWLADTCMCSHVLVPYYANYEYTESMRNDGPNPNTTYALARTSSDTRIRSITKVLDSIAKDSDPGKCDNDC